MCLYLICIWLLNFKVFEFVFDFQIWPIFVFDFLIKNVFVFVIDIKTCIWTQPCRLRSHSRSTSGVNHNLLAQKGVIKITNGAWSVWIFLITRGTSPLKGHAYPTIFSQDINIASNMKAPTLSWRIGQYYSVWMQIYLWVVSGSLQKSTVLPAGEETTPFDWPTEEIRYGILLPWGTASHPSCWCNNKLWCCRTDRTTTHFLSLSWKAMRPKWNRQQL